MADRIHDRHASPVYQILRASTRRLLKFVESEIARRGGGCATIYNDMLEMIGSRRNPATIGMAKACGGNIAKTYRHDATPWCALARTSHGVFHFRFISGERPR